MTQPESVQTLLVYLSYFPRLRVLFNFGRRQKETIYTFRRFCGDMIWFLEGESYLQFNTACRQLRYHDDHFSRGSGTYVARYYYTGDLPWSAAAARRRGWDEVIAVRQTAAALGACGG